MSNEGKSLAGDLPVIKGTSICASFDGIDQAGSFPIVKGWAFDRENPQEKLMIYVVGNNGVLGNAWADKPRMDVYKAGGPRIEVGFEVGLRAQGGERELKIAVFWQGQNYLLTSILLSEPLKKCGLTADDVNVVFENLFHRSPEDDSAIQHQLDSHKSKASFFSDLFRSPEFHEKNMDVIAAFKKLYKRA